MTNFILPNQYLYGNLNNCLVDLQSTNPDWFKDKIHFFGFEANLPFSIWNGGTLINDKFLNKNEIQTLYQSIMKPLVIDCSNVFISATDIFNIKENIFLEQYHTGLNYIIISDPDFLLLLKNKYPYYSYILSPFFPQEKITDEILNQCAYIMNYYNNINETIPKNKIIIILPINEICANCSEFLQCSKEEQRNIYSFKTTSKFRNCKNLYPYSVFPFNYLQFVQQGYTNFSFDGRSFPLSDTILMAHFYADFFGAEGKTSFIFNKLLEGYSL